MNATYLFLIEFVRDCQFTNETTFTADLIYKYITLILTPLSIISNCFAYIIFKQLIWKNCVMSKILQSLSLFEMLFNANVLIEASIRHKIEEQHPSLVELIIFIYSITASKVLMIVFLIARNWTVVILACHRYEAVCRPVGSAKYIRSDNINIIFSGILVVSILIALPRMMETKIEVCLPTLSINGFVPLLNLNKWYLCIHTGLLLFLIQNGGPVIIVCLCSIFVIRVINKMKRIRKSKINFNCKIKSFQPSGNKLIIVLCVSFFVLETPAFFSKILHHYFAYLQYSNLNMHIGLMANTFIYLDSIINAIVYVISNPTFRMSSKNLLLRLVYKDSSVNRLDRDSLTLNVTNNVSSRIIRTLK